MKRAVIPYDFNAFGQAIKAARMAKGESRKNVSDDIGNDKPRNRDDYIFRKGLYHAENVCVPTLRGLSYLVCDSPDFFVYVPEHS